MTDVWFAVHTDQDPTLPRPRPPSSAGLKINTKSTGMAPSVVETPTGIIHAPTPRRHLLESSASQHWLHTPPHSPTSSRAVSPTSTTASAFSPQIHHHQPLPPLTAPRSPALSASAVRQRFATHRRSFSALLEQEQRERTRSAASGGVGKGSSEGGGGGSMSTLAKASLRHQYQQHVGHYEREESSMGRRWIRWMHKRGVKHLVVPFLLCASMVVKLAVSLGSYSGRATPPMYGDYEAQRHWMELTLHLPFRQWYTYDLQYWGLDYPPLTAYVSWICGVVANWIDPSWVALDSSRGIESAASKVFMRLSVLVTDALVYIPALLLFARVWQGTRSSRTQELSLLTLLFQPALLLVDFGHFQYNSVMLGFTLLAIDFFASGRDVLGAFFFVLSLGFKQMALYYAPAIGTYLVAKCLYLGPSQGSRLFTRLGLVTASTFILLFLPFLPPFASLSDSMQPIIRIFPFARGLFEDKVANFWCASNVVFKWKLWASRTTLIRLSTSLTALGFLPAVVGLVVAAFKLANWTSSASDLSGEMTARKASTKEEQTPFLPLLPYAMLTSSMSFFLFSFQVHEKTILLPLLPLTLLLSGANVDSAVYNWGVLANNVGVFSMWPLLQRDGLAVQYIALLVLWNRMIGYNPFKKPKSFVQLVALLVYPAAFLLHVAEWLIAPPSRYPDLFPVLNVLISTPVFVLTWLWSIKSGVEVGWALGGIGSSRRSSASATATSGVMTTAGSGNVGGQAGADGVIGSVRQSGGRSVSLGYGSLPRKRLSSAYTTTGSVAGDE